MKLEQHTLTLKTSGRGTRDITDDVQFLVSSANINQGICHIFLQHTSASLMICENADPQVQIDLEHFLSRLVPDGDPLFKHVVEGKDDMPAHIRNILTQTEISIPIQAQRLALGTWQGLFLYEHRKQSHKRTLLLTLLGS